MLQFSLVFILQERGPRQKTRLMTDIITFAVGNSGILNQDGKDFKLCCLLLLKMFSENSFLASCLLTIPKRNILHFMNISEHLLYSL